MQIMGSVRKLETQKLNEQGECVDGFAKVSATYQVDYREVDIHNPIIWALRSSVSQS